MPFQSIVSTYSSTKIVQGVASLYPGQHWVSSDILIVAELIMKECCFLALLIFT